MVTFEGWDAWSEFGFFFYMLIGRCDFSKINILTKFKEEMEKLFEWKSPLGCLPFLFACFSQSFCS